MADTELVEVTQADREAAASIYLANDDTRNADPILHGEWDATATVQAFARHRIAEQERCAKVLSDAEPGRRRWVNRVDCLAAIRAQEPE